MNRHGYSAGYRKRIGVFLPSVRLVMSCALAYGALTTATWSQNSTSASGPAASQAPEAWSSRCTSGARTGEPDCAVEQRVVLRETGQMLASVTVRVPPDTREPVMMVRIPLGLFLPAGLSYSVDGSGEEKLELQTCDAQGCYAASTISDDLLQSLKAGEELSLTFQNLQKETISVPVSLAGFTAAFTKIE